MKSIHVELLTSAVKASQYPQGDRPDIVLAGRSNVGKSSFINCMFNRKNLARTSSKPGKTRLLNFYTTNFAYFVDLPGYGYARVSKSSRKQWQGMIESYFIDRDRIELVLLLVDMRHKPSKNDIEMKAFIDACNLPFFVIATKADKVKSNEREQKLSGIKASLNLETTDQILPFSSVSREGRDEAWEIIQAVLAGDFSA